MNANTPTAEKRKHITHVELFKFLSFSLLVQTKHGQYFFRLLTHYMDVSYSRQSYHEMSNNATQNILSLTLWWSEDSTVHYSESFKELICPNAIEHSICHGTRLMMVQGIHCIQQWTLFKLDLRRRRKVNHLLFWWKVEYRKYGEKTFCSFLSSIQHCCLQKKRNNKPHLRLIKSM